MNSLFLPVVTTRRSTLLVTALALGLGLAGCSLNPGTPDRSTTLSSRVRVTSPSATAAAAGPDSPAGTSTADGTSSPATHSAPNPNAAFCTTVHVRQNQLAAFPSSAAEASRVQPLWAMVNAAAPAAVKPVVAELTASIGMIANGAIADVDSELIRSDLDKVAAWVTLNCR